MRFTGLAIACVVLAGCSYSGLGGTAQPFAGAQPISGLMDSPDGLTAGEGERASKSGRAARANPAADTSAARARWMRTETPVVGSAEWKRDEEEDARKETQMNRRMNGICKGC